MAEVMVTATFQFNLEIDDDEEYLPDDSKYIENRDRALGNIEACLRKMAEKKLIASYFGLDVTSEDEMF